jgi:SAM-dependent methyltransferase
MDGRATAQDDHVAGVREYYEANTSLFLRFGQGGDLGAIRRAVWGPGVKDRRAAFHYVDELVLAELGRRGIEAPRIVDLGCGVGASLVYLAHMAPVSGLGVTLSASQAQRGQERVRADKLDEKIDIRTASYLDLPPMAPADLALAIESFVPGPDPRAFFHAAAGILKPHGILVLCDDFLDQDATWQREPDVLRRFRRGWHAASLVRPAAADQAASAEALDLVHEIDLTPYLELRRPRDLWIAALVRLFGWLPLSDPRWLNLVGGHALQQCLSTGLVRYLFRVWVRR